MSSNHFGVLLAAFGERDHKLGKTVAANLIVIKPELDARFSEGATQRDKLLVNERFGEHGNLERLLVDGR